MIVIVSLRMGAGDVSFAPCTLSVHTVRPFYPPVGCTRAEGDLSGPAGSAIASCGEGHL